MTSRRGSCASGMCWYNRQMAAAATTLASIVTFTSIFSSDRIKINSAGISAAENSKIVKISIRSPRTQTAVPLRRRVKRSATTAI